MAIVTSPVVWVSGDPLTLNESPAELPAVISGATLTIHSVQDHTTVPLLTVTGAVTNTGVLQPDGTYTAQVTFSLTGVQTALLTGGYIWWGYILTAPDGYTTEIIPLQPQA